MELIQALANIMSIPWAFHGATTEGPYCTAQAAIKHLGDVGAALFTMFLAIMTAIPTLCPATLRRNTGRRIVHYMIAFVAVFWLLIIAIPAAIFKDPPLYGSTGYVQCFLSTDGVSRS